MSAPAAIKRRFEKNIKQVLDTAEATQVWRAWVTKHIDIIAVSNLPLHVFASQRELSVVLSCGAWTDPHPHADFVPLLDEYSTEATALRLLPLIDAFKEIEPEGASLTEVQAREIVVRTSKPGSIIKSRLYQLTRRD
jgi:hypothetical protein